MGLTPVPDDQIATIVTSLEMRSKPPLRPAPPSPLRLTHWQSPASEKYKTLFRRVGEPWLAAPETAPRPKRIADVVNYVGPVEGFQVVRLNQRNCGGTEHLTDTLYHSGLTAAEMRVPLVLV